MHLNCFLHFFRTLFFGVLAYSAASVATEAPNYYDKAVSDFENGRYTRAISGFKMAKESGLDTASLLYNLGVSYYRLEQYGMAAKHFHLLLERNTMGDLASYNLGLISLKQNRPADALLWFRQCIEVSNNPKLRALARAGVKLANPKARAIARRSWSGLFMIGLAEDDNVTLVEDTPAAAASNVSDTSLGLFASGSMPVHDTPGGGQLFFNSSFYAANYLSTSSSNIEQYQAGITYRHKMNSWKTASKAYYRYYVLGSKGFSKTTSLEFSARSKINGWLRTRLRYRFQDIQVVNPLYQHLDGALNRADIRVYLPLPPGNKLRMDYVLEASNLADNAVPFTSYSPVRQALKLRYTKTFVNHISAGLDYRYRSSDYQKASVLTGGGALVRKDQRTKVKIFATYPFEPWTGKVAYQYMNNSSNMPTKEYLSNKFQVDFYRTF